ncbi:ATP-binding cassette domain-containing protein [bacterium]|nr:ATP-binding cassette domain-containing protein [bacterium]MCI0603164.1 ATP-binding cassette domain-containing protein [bacterium]
MQEKEVCIKIEKLCKSFNHEQVLNGVNLRVRESETVAVLGRSGTGKSVLLKLMIGLMKPDSGSIRIKNQEMTALPLEKLNEARKRIGFLFQYAALYDSLTVEGNVEFPLLWHSKLSKEERREKTHQLLSRVGMEDAAKKMPGELSGGMKKRVALARSLALDPSIMLLDEPTAGLDPVTAAEIHELFSGLRGERKVSTVVVTHDMYTVQAISDRVVMLHEGRIVFEGAPERLEESSDPQVSEFMKHTM